MAAKNSILEYTKRIGRSIALAGYEVLKENAPTATSFIEGNSQTVKEAIKKATSPRELAGEAAQALKIDYITKSAKQTVDNLKDSIKTGNFYSSQRSEAMENEAMGSLMQNMLGDIFDMTEGDLNPDEMSEEELEAHPVKGIPTVTKGDVVVSQVVAGETRRATNAITDVLSNISNLDNANRKAIASIQISQNERQALLLNNGFGAVTQGLNSLIEFNNSILRIQAENTKVYQEHMMNSIVETNAILKEMVEMQRSVYKVTNKKKTEEGEEGLDDLEGEGKKKVTDIFRNGLDLKAYAEYVKGNIKNNPFYMMASMMLDSLPMMIKDIVANPLHFLTKKGIEMVFGTATDALTRLDNSIRNGFQTALAKLFDYGHGKNGRGITGLLARLFGYKEQDASFRSLDASKYNRGAMSWNGIAQKALVEIIPGHLRKIEAALTGQGERLFDYKSGKWTSAKAAKNYENRIDKANVKSATSQLKEEMTKLLSPYSQNMSREDRKAMNNSLNQFLTGIYKKGYVSYEDIIERPQGYGENERLTQLFLRVLANVKRGTISGVTSQITKAKRNKKALVENMGFEDQGIQNEIVSGALNNIIGKTNEDGRILFDGSQISSPASNLVKLKDSRGHTLYDYQMMIYNELVKIRQGGGMGGGTGEGTPNPIPPDSSPDTTESTPSTDETTTSSGSKVGQRKIDDEAFKSNNREDIRKRIEKRITDYFNRIGARKAHYAGLNLKTKEQGNDWFDNGFSVERFLNNDQYANKILKEIEENGQKYLKRYDLLERNKDVTVDEEGNVIEDERSFIDKLAGAESLGDKFDVISKGLKGFVKAPNRLLTSVVVAADKYIFDFLYSKDTNTRTKDGREIRGFFDKIIYEAENLFEKANEKLTDLFKKAKDSDIFGKIKKFLKDHFDIDVDEKLEKIKGRARSAVAPLGKVLKSGIKNNFREIKDAFVGTANDLGIKKKKTKSKEEVKQENREKDNLHQEGYVDDDDYWGDMGAFASGAKNVKRGGLAFISEGEAIIPADINPWNPKRNQVDREEQSKNESRMKQRFMSKLSSSIGNYVKQIPQHADGTGSFGAYLSEDDLAAMLYASLRDQIESGEISEDNFRGILKKQFGIYRKPGIFKSELLKRFTDEDILAKTNGIKREDLKAALDDYAANKDKYYRQKKIREKEEDYRNNNGIFTGVNQFMLSAFGRDMDLAVEDVNDFVVKHSPEIATGGIGGALLSLILPLGGPMMGAMVGAITTLLAKNKTFTDYMFGSEITDPKTGKVITKEGVIPRKIVNTLKKYVPDAKKYGIVGGLAGLITPFGPIGGIMIGTGASIIKNNQALQDILFGDEGGLLNKDRKAAIRKALPNIGGAVLGTLFLGPFGLLGNAVLGSGLGLLSTTEQFKRIILGTKDRNGVRRGGLAGAIRRNITEPFKRSMEEMRDKLGGWFRDKILTPVGRGLLPIGKVATSVISAGISGIVKHFRDSVGGFFFDKMFDRILGGVRSAGGFGKYLGKKVGGLAAFGAKQVERLGDRTKLWAVKHGFGENLSVQDRLETYGRNKMGHTIQAAFDRNLANMNSQELEANRDAIELLNMAANGKFDLDTKRQVRGEVVSTMEDELNSIAGGKGGIKYTTVDDYKNKLLNIQSDDDLENIVKEIQGLDYLTPENKKKFIDAVVRNGTRIRKYQKRRDMLKDGETMNALRQRVISTFGLENFSDEEINAKLAEFEKYANAQLDVKNKENKNKLRELQNDENVPPEQATLENVEKMTEFQKAQLEEQKEMNKNLRILIDISLGKASPQDLKETNSISALRDNARMNLANAEAEAHQKHLKNILKEGDEQTQEDIENVKKQIFGDKLGRGVDAIENLSDEKLINLLTSDKKKRAKSVTYLRAVAKNYDSTLSKIMNADKFLELSTKGMKRVTELTLRGYEVNENDYKDIEELSDYGYKAIIELAKMGVKIDSYKAIDRYFEKYSTDTQKKKSLEALLNFAGVRLEDGKRIADVLTTSEITDNLEDDEVRALRYNNPQSSFQVGINKAMEEGKVPEGLKLKSTAKGENITYKRKTADVNYDEDTAVGDTNREAFIDNSARIVDDAVKGIYDSTKSILKSALKISAKAAEAAARTTVPGAGTVIDSAKAVNQAKKNEKRLNEDEEYADAVNEAAGNYRDEVNSLNKQYESGKDIKDISKDYLGIKDEEQPEKAPNSVTDAQNKKNEAKVDADPEVKSHAAGVLSALKNAAIDGIAEKISSGSTDKFKQSTEEVEKTTQKAETAPINVLEEHNNLREGNSITQAREAGMALVNNVAAQQSSGKTTQSGDNENVPTAEGDIIEYTKDRNGNLIEKHNKNNVQNRQKQQYKLSLQERSTRALEMIAKGGGFVKDNAGKVAKKAAGGLLDGIGSLLSLPIQLIKGMISMVPFLGPLLGLAGGGIKFIGKYLAEYGLDKLATTGIGKGIGGLIGKMQNTRIGNAIARRLGLDKFKNKVDGVTGEEEEPNAPHPVVKDIDLQIRELNKKMDNFLDAYKSGKLEENAEETTPPTTETESEDTTETESEEETSPISDELPIGDDEEEPNKKDDKNKQDEEEKTKSNDQNPEDTKADDKNKQDEEEKTKSNDQNPEETKKDDKTKQDNKPNQEDNKGKKPGLKTRVKNKYRNIRDSIKNRLKNRGNKKGVLGKVSHVGKTVFNAARNNKKAALAVGALGTLAALEGTNYGTFTGEGLSDNVLYASGLATHAFDAEKYGLDLTPGNQLLADRMIRAGTPEDQVAQNMRDRMGLGYDTDNVYDNAAETATGAVGSVWDMGKDALNYLVDSPINNPLTEMALGHVVGRLSGSKVKGAAANTALEMLNKYRTGEFDDSSIFGMLAEGGLDFATNYALNAGLDMGQDSILDTLDQRDQDDEDQRYEDNEQEINPEEVERNKAKDKPKDPRDEIRGLTREQKKEWFKDPKNIERLEQYRRDLQEYNESNRVRRPNDGSHRRTEPGARPKRSLRSRLASSSVLNGVASGVKSIGKGIGKGLGSILKTKKGKVGAAALIATPILTGLFGDDNAAEASVLKSAHAFETKGSIKSNIDEQQFTEDAEAAEVQDTPTTETEEESSGILDAIRNNPVLSSAIGFVGGVKGGEWGGKLGEKLLGSKGKLIGSLLGGTVGGNILDPTNITPEGILETFITNKVWDKGTELVGNIGKNKDEEDQDSDLSTPDDLPDNNRQGNRPDDDTKPKTSLKDRFKNIIGDTKGKISDIVSGTKQKMETVTNAVQNLKMKADTTSTLDTLRNIKDEGSLKVQSLVEQLKSGIKSLTSKLSRWITGKNALNAIKNFSAKLIENITKPQNLKKIASKLAKSSLKSMAMAGGPYVAAAVVGIGAISDFIHGYNSADELYQLKPGLATTGMKIVAGFVTALVGVIPFVSILIPEDFVLELAVEYIGPAFGFGKKELEELRKSGDEKDKTEEGEVVESSTFGDDFKSMVANASKGIISKVVATADDAANAIGDISTTLANKVGESATVAKNWVTDTAKTVGDWITDNASRGIDYLKDKASSAADTVGEIMDSAGTKVKEGYESVKNTIKGYLPSFGSGKHSMFGMNKFFSQLDPRFAMQYNAQGDSIPQTMSDSGCGPAALSNAMSSFGLDVDPRLAAQYALQNGYKETDGGTKPEFFTDMMNKLGTGSSRLHNQGEIIDNLKQGKPVILMGKDGRGETKQNPYAENPHYVTATGIDNKGNIIVQDPESFTPNKVYKASNILNKSTIAIGAGKGKSSIKRLYGRARSIIRRYPRTFYGRSRRPRYGMGEGDMGAQIYEYLHKKIGLSSIATAAIMGNMMAESGLMPNRVQGDGIITADEITVDGSTGYGLCQWTYITRQQGLVDFAAQQGKSTSDYQVQCDYLMHELENSYPGCIEAMDNCGDDVRRAAIVFHDMFEGSADTDEMKARRSDYAEQILANEGKGIVEAGTYAGGSGGSSSGGQQKKNTGLFGAISNITSILSSALNPFGNSGTGKGTPNPLSTVGKGKHSNRFSSKYGRFKHFIFGRGDEDTVDTTPTDSATDTTNTTANMDAQQVQDAQNAEANTQNQTKATPTKSSPSTTSSGGLFGGLEAFAKQMASPLSKAMGQFGSVLKSSIGSVYGSKLKFLFGDDNPFLSIFGGQSSSSGNKPGQSGPGQTMNVKVAGNPVDTLLGSMAGAVVTSDYGAVEGRPTAGAHGGVDIGADKGTPIPSPISGTVVDLGSGWGGGYGNYIQIKDSKGNYHMFAHCDSQSVSVGQQVQPGTVLGTVGDTGQSYGAHLHYEIDPPENQGAVKGGATLNPNSYTGAGKHRITSMGMGKLVLPKYGMGLDETLSKSSNETFSDLNNLNLEESSSEQIENLSNMKPINVPKDENYHYDGFGTEEISKKYKFGTGWFSDFTKRSINTIKDAFKKWNVKWDDQKDDKSKDTTTPTKQPTSVPKESNEATTDTSQQTATPKQVDSNVRTVTDSQKLDAILDAMNENNRLLQQQNQLISSIINIASNYLNSNQSVSNKQQLTMNTNTRGNNYDPQTVSIKSQLSQFGNGSQFGLGDRFGTRDSDGFSEIIRTLNEVASR